MRKSAFPASNIFQNDVNFLLISHIYIESCSDEWIKEIWKEMVTCNKKQLLIKKEILIQIYKFVKNKTKNSKSKNISLEVTSFKETFDALKYV